MARRLKDHRLHNGSRKFGDLPMSVDVHTLADHLKTLEALEVTKVFREITDSWVDFAYRGFTFNANEQYGEYWFTVDDPSCPDDVLIAVLEHAALLLDPPPP